MMEDFSRLSMNWQYWSRLSRFADATTVVGRDGAAAAFKAKDWSYYLKSDADRWILDEVDDRGQLRSDTANFSDFSLAEKYLIWNWASIARSSVGATPLGRELYSLGLSPEVEKAELQEGIYLLKSSAGDAVLVGVEAVVFSHIMSKPVDEIEKIVRAGLPVSHDGSFVLFC